MLLVGKMLHRFLQLCCHNGHCPACGRCSTAVGRHRCTCSTAALQGTEPARCSCCSIYIDNCSILHCCCRCPQACRAVNGTSRSFIIHPVLVGNACPQSEWLIWRVFWSENIRRLRQLSRSRMTALTAWSQFRESWQFAWVSLEGYSSRRYYGKYVRNVLLFNLASHETNAQFPWNRRRRDTGEKLSQYWGKTTRNIVLSCVKTILSCLHLSAWILAL